VLVRGLIGQQFYTHLEMADLDTLSRRSISGDGETPVEDSGGAWSPDGTRLAIARRYLDGRFTNGKQIYLLEPDMGEAEPLVLDREYNHSVMRWDASGRQIVFQRFSLSAPGARPEIWTVDVETGALAQVADNAFLPAWVP
jgi:dipeptidyl aminopeptidase/acylaminoacyl peptidase